MIVVDSSGWLEFLTEGPLAGEFAKRLQQPAAVITPTIIMYEVYKHSKRLRGEAAALDAVAAMQKTRVVPLSDELALVAADLSLEHKLPMADAIVLATARLHEAEVVTSDVDFQGVPGVTYIPKKRHAE
ncbi:MAG TPA: type II toxin-antitoxin system VapC family toxin [Thermoanaerobaculia bacterium]|nr:type II toxin-antitoxin system VapC family toxin [Thermoanaerobaculia bacterium]